MKGTLGLEHIGAPHHDLMRQWARAERAMGVGRNDPPPTFGACVREIYRNADGDLAYRDLYGRRDYSRANSKGTRGVYVWYILEPDTLYWVNEPISWKRSEQYYCAVKLDGSVYRLTDEEAEEWLNAL